MGHRRAASVPGRPLNDPLVSQILEYAQSIAGLSGVKIAANGNIDAVDCHKHMLFTMLPMDLNLPVSALVIDPNIVRCSRKTLYRPAIILHHHGHALSYSLAVSERGKYSYHR